MPTDGRITSLGTVASLSSTDLVMVISPGNASSGVNYQATVQQIASYVAGTTAAGSNTQVQYNNGGVLGGSPALTWVGPNLRVGTVGTVGGLQVVGQTAGGVIFNAVASSAVWTFTLPPSAGTANLPLVTDGLGTTAWTTLKPPGGGTGLTAYTTGDLLYASNATTLARLAAATSGFLLVSQGTSIAPAWSSAAPITSMTFGDGSVSAPSIAYTNETTTGFYRVGTGIIGLTGVASLIASLGTSVSTFSGEITMDRTVSGAVTYLTARATGTSTAATGAGFRLITDAGTFSFVQYASGSAGNTDITPPFSTNSTTRTLFINLQGANTTSAGNLTIRSTSNFTTRLTLNGISGVLSLHAGVSCTNATTGTQTIIGGLGVTENICAAGSIRSSGATAGLGFAAGAGTTVTQGTSRTTGVTANAACGAITLFSAAGTSAFTTFTVTNSAVSSTDVILVNQRSGTDLYRMYVTNVTTGAFNWTFLTTGGTTTEQPIFNFAVIKAVTA